MAVELKEEIQKRKVKLATDPNISASTMPVPSIDQYVIKRKQDEDSGAGIFGALNHISFETEAEKRNKKKKIKQEYKFDHMDYTEDDSEQPPAWKVNRRVLESDLEEELATTPFETYPLTRGKKATANLFSIGKLKIVGVFKGLYLTIIEA